MKLCVDKLVKRYSDADKILTVVDGLSFDFPEQGAFAITGRSGVGKSTLLHLLGGLDRPSAGDVYWDSLSIANADADQLSSRRGQQVGFVFQFHHLLPEFTALENVSMPLIIAGLTESEASRRAAEVLVRVGLENRSDHRPAQLSGGEQQRVAIARAIVTRPKLILADEPTGNLDLQTAKAVQELLLEVQRELSNLLIVVTHSAELAGSMQQHLEMLPGGALVPAVR